MEWKKLNDRYYELVNKNILNDEEYEELNYIQAQLEDYRY